MHLLIDSGDLYEISATAPVYNAALCRWVLCLSCLIIYG
jgi:hypothetical protein